MTTLCLDFGNTRLKAAIFNNDIISDIFIVENDQDQTIEKIIEKYTPQKSILSSVINHNSNIENVLAAKTIFHKLSAATTINFTTPVGKPETIGADRLALCASAVHFYPKKNNLIIALGSCITYNFINQEHQFLGGSISPGMNMRFKAMHDYTALLPLEKENWNIPLIGYDTKTNLQSGVLYGMACEIEGVIKKYYEKFNNFNVVLTGGNTSYFAVQLKSQIFASPNGIADQNFLFKGLYALSELNNIGI